MTPKFAEFTERKTFQIGSWSTDNVPVLLTFKSDSNGLSAAICEIIARLRKRFIVLAPTAKNFDVRVQEILNHADAGFFALNSIVQLTQNGTLQPMRTPGELFARFNPKPKQNEEAIAPRNRGVHGPIRFDEPDDKTGNRHCF